MTVLFGKIPINPSILSFPAPPPENQNIIDQDGEQMTDQLGENLVSQ